MPFEQRHLQDVEWVEVAVAHRQRPRQPRLVGEQRVQRRDREHLGDRAGVLVDDEVEHMAEPGFDQPVDVAAGQVEIGLCQRHPHQREELTQERPLVVHLHERVAVTGVAGGREPAADAKPAGHDLP